MSCEYGHAFRSFSKSRDLYCVNCGEVRIANLAPAAIPSPSRVESRAPIQQTPSEPDPDRDRALSIMAAAAQPDQTADFEAALQDIFARNPLPEDMAERLYQDALAFGPTLDLDHFENNVVAPVAQIQNPTPTFDEDLDRMIET